MAKKIQADLHVHTSASDGTFAPREVVERAAGIGLNVIAITDHDTMNGIAEAQQCAAGHGVNVIAGVEISTFHGEQEFHVIGLYTDLVSATFLEKLEEMRRARHDRIFEMVGKLREMGIDLDGQEIIDSADGGSAGRTHVAQALMDHGHVDTLSEAFYKYVGDRGPAFVPKKFMSVEDAIIAIRKVGGVSILAHPGVTDRDGYIPIFAQMGLNGLEAFYPTYSREQTTHYLDMANRMGMVVGGGSDCHGKRRTDIMLGRVRVPGIYVERITALARLQPGSVENKEESR